MILRCKKCNTPVTDDLHNSYNKLSDMILSIKIMSDEEISQYDEDDLTYYDTHRDIVYPHSYTKQSHAIRMMGCLSAKYTAYKVETPKMYYFVSPESISKELAFNLDNTEYVGCCGLDSSPFVCQCGEVLGDIDTDCWKLPLLNIRVSKVFH